MNRAKIILQMYRVHVAKNLPPMNTATTLNRQYFITGLSALTSQISRSREMANKIQFLIHHAVRLSSDEGDFPTVLHNHYETLWVKKVCKIAYV